MVGEKREQGHYPNFTSPLTHCLPPPQNVVIIFPVSGPKCWRARALLHAQKDPRMADLPHAMLHKCSVAEKMSASQMVENGAPARSELFESLQTGLQDRDMEKSVKVFSVLLLVRFAPSPIPKGGQTITTPRQH